MNPTPYLVVSNMFNPEDETERNWDLDLAEDVKGEVERQYGHVRRIKVDKMSAVSEEAADPGLICADPGRHC